MRKITVQQMASFMLLLVLILLLTISTTAFVYSALPSGDMRGVATLIVFMILFYLFAFLVYRFFLYLYPLQEGVIEQGSQAEFSAQVNILFYLLVFNSLIRTHFIPVPLLKLVYLALGTKMGVNTFSAGVILDPPLTVIGRDSIIGHDAVLFSHAIEGRRFALSKIVIGDNVTIGAKSIIMSGVSIGDGSIVSSGAVVTTGTQIGPGELWGKVPARLIKKLK